MTEATRRLWQTLSVVEKEAFYLQSVMQRLFPRQGAISAAEMESLLGTPEGIDRLESIRG